MGKFAKQIPLTCYVLVSVLFGFLFACSKTERGPSFNVLDALAFRTWVLQTYSSVETDSMLALMEPAATISFRIVRGEIVGFFGFDGCNEYTAQAVQVTESNVLAVDNLSVGELVCPDLQNTEYLLQTDHFYSVLMGTIEYRLDIQSDVLTLTTQAGRFLEFRD